MVHTCNVLTIRFHALGTNRYESVLQEHDRTVNRVHWHTIEPTNLISASQDGCVKLWDLRVKGKSQLTLADVEPVRDVRVHPSRGDLIAAGYENGLIQIWDLKMRQRVSTIHAHQGTIGSLDWHPTSPDVLASGSRDCQIRVWDLSKDSKTPMKVIKTIAPVGVINWRPGHAEQIASAAGKQDFSAHLWDLNQPFRPGTNNIDRTQRARARNNCSFLHSPALCYCVYLRVAYLCTHEPPQLPAHLHSRTPCQITTGTLTHMRT